MQKKLTDKEHRALAEMMAKDLHKREQSDHKRIQSLLPNKVDTLWALIVSREITFPDSGTGRVEVWGGVREKGAIKKALETLRMQKITEDKKEKCFQFTSGEVVEEWIAEGEFESHLPCDFKVLEKASKILNKVFSFQGTSNKFLAVPKNHMMSGLGMKSKQGKQELCILLFLLHHYGFIQLKFERHDCASPTEYFYSYMPIERKVLTYNQETCVLSYGVKKIKIKGLHQKRLATLMSLRGYHFVRVIDLIHCVYGKSKTLTSYENDAHGLVIRFTDLVQRAGFAKKKITKSERHQEVFFFDFKIRKSNTCEDFKLFCSHPEISAIIQRMAPMDRGREEIEKERVFAFYLELLTAAKGSWNGIKWGDISESAVKNRILRWGENRSLVKIVLKLLRKGYLSISINTRK